MCPACKREDLPVVPGPCARGARPVPCAHVRPDGEPCAACLGSPPDPEWTDLVWSDDAWWDLGNDRINAGLASLPPLMTADEAAGVREEIALLRGRDEPDDLKLPPVVLPKSLLAPVLEKKARASRAARKKRGAEGDQDN